jgi:hypothetical protein
VFKNKVRKDLLGDKIMATIKDEVIQMIKKMPEDISVEDIMAELYFRYQVDEGLGQLDEGSGIPHEEIERRMAKLL